MSYLHRVQEAGVINIEMECAAMASLCHKVHVYVHVRGHVHVQKMYIHVYTCCHGFESHPRQLIFLRESDCLGCAVLLCLVVCLTLLVSSFLPSHLMYTNTCRSDAHTCRYIYMYMYKADSTVINNSIHVQCIYIITTFTCIYICICTCTCM